MMVQPLFGGNMVPEISLGDTLMSRHSGLGRRAVVWRIAFAVSLSWALSEWLFDSSVVVFAPMTTLLVVQASTSSTVGLSLQRVLGAGLGVALASLWLSAVGMSWWSFVLAMTASLLVARALPWSVIGQLQIPVAVLFVLVLGNTSVEQGIIRTMEVGLGGLVAVAIALLLPLKPDRRALDQALATLRDHQKVVLDDIVSSVKTLATSDRPVAEQPQFLATSRRLRDFGDLALSAYAEFYSSTALNHRAASARQGMAQDASLVRRLVVIGMHVRSIASAADYVFHDGAQDLIDVQEFEELNRATTDAIVAACGSDPGRIQLSMSSDFAAADARFQECLSKSIARISAVKISDREKLGALSLMGRYDHILNLLNSLLASQMVTASPTD